MTKKEITIAEQNAFNKYMDFIALCRILFGYNPLKSITDLKEDSPFYETAHSIVEEFGMDWENLSAEDNNEVMLTMLDEAFNGIRNDDESGKFTYNIAITIKENKSKKAE